MNPGERVGGYILSRRIGAGGMGEVWLAEHVMLGRRAAIKLLHRSVSGRSDIVTRFFNEARAATAIADPGIVQIYDFGHTDDGAAYIVMELLEGETLDARCRRLGVVAVADALRIVRQVATSLGAAHARGIVHRDLKPDNIFLVPDPEVVGGERAKILDFGIAKLSGDAGVKTQTSAVMGTPMFMSPEQCRGAGLVDARSDVYSLGCVLFAILAGRPPFVGEGIGDLIVSHMQEVPARVRRSNANVPPAVDALVARCLEKQPSARFANGADLAAALHEIRVATQPTIAAVPPPFVTAGQTTLSTAASSLVGAAPPRRRAGLWVAIAAVGALGGIGAVIATRTTEATRVATDTTYDAPDAAVVEPDAAPADASDDASDDASVAIAPIDAGVATAQLDASVTAPETKPKTKARTKAAPKPDAPAPEPEVSAQDFIKKQVR